MSQSVFLTLFEPFIFFIFFCYTGHYCRQYFKRRHSLAVTKPDDGYAHKMQRESYFWLCGGLGLFGMSGVYVYSELISSRLYAVVTVSYCVLYLLAYLTVRKHRQSVDFSDC